MRTECALVLAMALLAMPSRAEVSETRTEDGRFAARFEFGVPVEVTLVGLTGGLRPEVLFRPGGLATVSRIRIAVGFFGGPEQFFLPVSLGYRAVFRQGQVVQPLVGVGLELQHRFVSDLTPVRAFGGYLEGGVGFEVARGWSVGVLLAVDVMVVGMPGFGLGPRAFFTAQL